MGDVDRFIGEMMEFERKIEQTKQRVLDRLTGGFEDGDSVSSRGYVSHNNADRYREQADSVQKLDENKSDKRTVSDDSGRSIEHDGANRESDGQIINYSLYTAWKIKPTLLFCMR